MTAGRHATRDGSFGRSAAGPMLRGAVLIALAFAVGFAILAAFDPPATRVVTSGDGGDEVTAPGDATTTTTAPPAEDPPSDTPAQPQAHDPAAVTVLVANGSGVAGVAGKVTDQIVAPAGFKTSAATNANANVATSTLYYEAGYEADAAAVAALLSPAPVTAALAEPYPVPALAGANLVLVVGADLSASVQ